MHMVWLVVSVVLGAIGQVLFKLGANQLPETGLSLRFMIQCVTNFWIILGGLCYAASFFLWLYILKFFEVGFARSFVGAGYIITFALGLIFLGETFTVTRLVAILLITGGVMLLATEFGA